MVYQLVNTHFLTNNICSIFYPINVGQIMRLDFQCGQNFLCYLYKFGYNINMIKSLLLLLSNRMGLALPVYL